MPDVDVRLDHVTKSFGEMVAVDDLSLDVWRGEFFSLLGPSGCGKTTTLRMIGGFEPTTSGTVYLGDTDVTNLPPFKRNVNTVFQNYALFPHLTIYENVAFGLRRRKVPDAQVRTQVESMLKLVELPGFEQRKPTQLSGGQQQRVALARALINHPQVLLLDEPLGALDLKLRKQMQIELKGIQTEVGITFIYVTHDQEEAMTMSDRIAVMRAGRIEQLGDPESLYERPETAFVAGFLGVSNLLEGEVSGHEGGMVAIRLTDGTLIKAPAPKGGGSLHEVRLGVRPEKLRVLPATNGEAADQSTNVMEGVVLDSSYIGVSTQYLVETRDGHRMTAYAQNLETAGVAEARARGEKVRLTWQPRHTFVVAGLAEHVAGDPHAPEEEGDLDV